MQEEDSRRPPHSPAFRLEESGVVRMGPEKQCNEEEGSRRPPHSPALRLEESGVVSLGPEKLRNNNRIAKRERNTASGPQADDTPVLWPKTRNCHRRCTRVHVKQTQTPTPPL